MIDERTVIVVAILGVAVVAATSSLTSSSPPLLVRTGECSGIIFDLNATYSGSQSGYLTQIYGEIPLYCSSGTVPVDSVTTAVLFLHNLDGAHAHTIQKVSVPSPFHLIRISPVPPATINAGGNVTFDVTFEFPSIPGDYGQPEASVITF